MAHHPAGGPEARPLPHTLAHTSFLLACTSCTPTGYMAEPQALTETPVGTPEDQPALGRSRPRAGYKPHQKGGGGSAGRQEWQCITSPRWRAGSLLTLGWTETIEAAPSSQLLPTGRAQVPKSPGTSPREQAQLGGSQRAGQGDFPGAGSKAWELAGSREGVLQPSGISF